MLRRNRLPRDRVSKQLQASGVYSIGHGPHPYIVDDQTVNAVKKKKIYSFRSGVWYTTVLSIFLFWLPPFGQMIAGYVGGRKAGSPVKGMAAALAPMSFIFLLFFLRYMGHFVSEIDWIMGIPGTGAAWLGSNLPILGPAIEFASQYAHTFVNVMLSPEFFIYPYVLTVIFGYVGGILSLQRRKELEAQGKQHPFVPLIINQQAPKEPEDEQVVIGKVPDDWHMREDRKRGKW